MLKMQRPKSFKDLVLGILIVAVLGVGAYFIADALKAELVPGDIVVRSGNEEITALQNVTGEQRKNGSKACGGHFEIEEVADEFPVIRMDKGIVLEASQDPTAQCITRSITRISPSFTTAASGLRTLKTTAHTTL